MKARYNPVASNLHWVAWYNKGLTIGKTIKARFMGLLDSDDPRLVDIGLMMAGTKQIESKEGAHAAS